MNKLGVERRHVIDRESPLQRHSLNQRKMRVQAQGEVRVHGKTVLNSTRCARREEAKAERKQALFEATQRIFNRNFSENDLVTVFLYTEEFETSVEPNASVLDLTGLQSRDERFGEPEFFRKKS